MRADPQGIITCWSFSDSAGVSLGFRWGFAGVSMAVGSGVVGATYVRYWAFELILMVTCAPAAMWSVGVEQAED